MGQHLLHEGRTHSSLLALPFASDRLFSQMGTILRSLSIYPTEAQLHKWINEVAPELPSDYFAYDQFETLC
eukprot:3718260-Rhodomonas_salina.1